MKKSFIILFAISTLLSCKGLQENNQISITPAPEIVYHETILNNLKPFYYLKSQLKTKSVEDLMEEYKVPGLRIVFVDKGKISWSKSFGYATLKDSVKVDSNTVFTGASLGKPITAVAALKLVEQGVLDLDEDLNKKLKDWKVPNNEFTKNEKVTLRRLIGHTSGFNRYYGPNYIPYEELPTIEETLRGEKPSKHPAAKMVAVPGTKYIYSNPGYLIIEKLLEDVTNQKFESILETLVFQPCHMTSSSFQQPMPERLMKRRATGYSENLQPYPYYIISYKAAGGIWTTPNDLARFTYTLLTDHSRGTKTLLSTKMTNNIFNKGGNLEKLGFTLFNWKPNAQDILFRHTGQNYGYTSVIFGSVIKEQAVIIMANGVNTEDIFNHIQRAVAEAYHWDYFQPTAYEPYDIGAKDFKEYTGQYDWNDHFTVINMENDSLYLQLDNERYLLIPVEENTFLVPDISLLIILPKKPGGATIFLDKNGNYSRVAKTYE